MSCTLTEYEVVTIRPSAAGRVLTVMAYDGDDAIDRLYRAEKLADDEIPSSCRPSGHYTMPPL